MAVLWGNLVCLLLSAIPFSLLEFYLPCVATLFWFTSIVIPALFLPLLWLLFSYYPHCDTNFLLAAVMTQFPLGLIPVVTPVPSYWLTGHKTQSYLFTYLLFVFVVTAVPSLCYLCCDSSSFFISSLLWQQFLLYLISVVIAVPSWSHLCCDSSSLLIPVVTAVPSLSYPCCDSSSLLVLSLLWQQFLLYLKSVVIPVPSTSYLCCDGSSCFALSLLWQQFQHCPLLALPGSCPQIV